MTLGKNYKVFKLITGEIVITEIAETDDEGKYILNYPAMIVPVQQQGQIGFGKLMPFSSHNHDIVLDPKNIMIDSFPHPKIKEAYEQWAKTMRSQDSGIIVPNMKAPNIPESGSKAGVDFSKLNTM